MAKSRDAFTQLRKLKIPLKALGDSYRVKIRNKHGRVVMLTKRVLCGILQHQTRCSRFNNTEGNTIESYFCMRITRDNLNFDKTENNCKFHFNAYNLDKPKDYHQTAVHAKTRVKQYC